jgi:hypothetical protein
VKSLLLLLATAGLFASCASSPGRYDNHWNVGGLAPRLAYHGLSYKPHLSESYRDHERSQKESINLTLRRHLLNNNPDNPFQPEDSSLSNTRVPHSILPDPVEYFHLESLVFGVAISALTGVFVPVPFGSVLGTLEEGGPTEFVDGLHQTLTGSFRGILGEPAPVSEFRVRSTSL